MKSFKMFELFDTSNNYNYELIKTSDENEDDMKYKLYLYTFMGKETRYYVRISLFDVTENPHYNKSMDNFLTLDFMEAESYDMMKDSNFDIKYKNINKFDVYRVLNTVFDILKECKLKLNPWQIVFNCTVDRFKTYSYIMKKTFDDILLIQQKNELYNFYLYSRNFYHVDGNGNKNYQ